MSPSVALDSDTLRGALAAVEPALQDAVIRPVPNWGGFVNRSFEVRSGARRLFLKLASDPAIRAGLRRWREWGERLETLYGAPRTLAWVTIPGTPFAGLLSQWVDGSPPETLTRELVERVAPILDRLHHDPTLQAGLAGSFPPSTCADRYRDTLHDRFVEDLKGIARSPPPFLDPERLRWMEAKASELHTLISSERAFDETAGSPVHGDPWLDNLIVRRDGSVHLVDWDELAPGDPVEDWAILLGPGRRDLGIAIERRHLLPRPLTGAEEARLGLWSRATALDWVIDPLADWVEADPETDHGRAVRRANERLHEEAFARYTARYPV